MSSTKYIVVGTHISNECGNTFRYHVAFCLHTIDFINHVLHHVQFVVRACSATLLCSVCRKVHLVASVRVFSANRMQDFESAKKKGRPKYGVVKLSGGWWGELGDCPTNKHPQTRVGTLDPLTPCALVAAPCCVTEFVTFLKFVRSHRQIQSRTTKHRAFAPLTLNCEMLRMSC